MTPPLTVTGAIGSILQRARVEYSGEHTNVRQKRRAHCAIPQLAVLFIFAPRSRQYTEDGYRYRRR